MIFTRTGRFLLATAHLTWIAACPNSAMLEGGWSMSLIQTNIWSRICSMAFMSRHWAGRSITYASDCSRKAVVSCVVCVVVHCLGWKQSCVKRLGLPSLRYHDFHQLVVRNSKSSSRLAYETQRIDCRYGTERSGTRHQVESVPSVRGPTTRNYVAKYCYY